MNYHQNCEHCGHLVTAYTLPMNKGMADAFIQFAEKSLEKGGLKKGDIGLTNTQYSNFQNIRHFGIIKQDEKGSKWYLTDLGKRFYYGKIGIMTPCGLMNGKTLEDDHEAWQTHSAPRKVVMITDFLPFAYKQRGDYKEEKNTLFDTL